MLWSPRLKGLTRRGLAWASFIWRALMMRCAAGSWMSVAGSDSDRIVLYRTLNLMFDRCDLMFDYGLERCGFLTVAVSEGGDDLPARRAHSGHGPRGAAQRNRSLWTSRMWTGGVYLCLSWSKDVDLLFRTCNHKTWHHINLCIIRAVMLTRFRYWITVSVRPGQCFW